MKCNEDVSHGPSLKCQNLLLSFFQSQLFIYIADWLLNVVCVYMCALRLMLIIFTLLYFQDKGGTEAYRVNILHPDRRH